MLDLDDQRRASDHNPGKRYYDDLRLLPKSQLEFIYRVTRITRYDDFCRAALHSAMNVPLAAQYEASDISSFGRPEWSEAALDLDRGGDDGDDGGDDGDDDGEADGGSGLDGDGLDGSNSSAPRYYPEDVLRDTLGNVNRQYYTHVEKKLKRIILEMCLIDFKPPGDRNPLWCILEFLVTLSNSFRLHDFHELYCDLTNERCTPREFMFRVRNDVTMNVTLR